MNYQEGYLITKFNGRLPRTIAKYRSWENSDHKDALLSNYLWFADPNAFKDSFDFNLKLYQGNPAEFYRMVNDAEMKEGIWAKVLEWDPFYSRPAFDMMYAYNANRPLVEIEAGHNKVFKEKFGILSLTDKLNKDKHWYHYSDCKPATGFCILYDTKTILDDLSLKGMPFSKTIYKRKLTEFSLGDNMPIELRFMLSSFQKKASYSWESEFRIVVPLESGVLSGRKYFLTRENLAGVQVYHKARMGLEDEIMSSLPDGLKDIPVWRASKPPKF